MRLFQTIILSFVSASVAFSSTTVPAIEALEKTSKAFIFWDFSAKKRLADKNADELIHPASLTKIMTAIIALENINPQATVTITPAMTHVKPTRLGFKVGERFFVHDLIRAAMIESDNDAALAVAIAVGGSEERFVEMMNAKAKTLGMNQTSFRNPHGFDHREHLSTANDLLRLTQYALKNPIFDGMISLKEYSFTDLSVGKPYRVRTHNLLLRNYPYALGVKTGFTNQAGPCLIARAKKNGEDLLLVMLDSRARWKTAEAVFESQLGNPQEVALAVPSKTLENNVGLKKVRANRVTQIKKGKVKKTNRLAKKVASKKVKRYALAAKSAKTRTK